MIWLEILIGTGLLVTHAIAFKLGWELHKQFVS
jgi:hypothetical protein